MKELSVFDVIGPKMIGPSSSHTAGALRISAIARQFIKGPVVEAVFVLYGSFAETYKGHGTDRALLAGILGYDTGDLRIRDSYEHAEAEGISYSFITDSHTAVEHSNTVEIRLTGEEGQTIDLLGVSVGGGEVEIRKIGDIEVAFRGEYCTLLVNHQDRPGVVAYLSQQLSEEHINIAFMKLYREGKGDRAFAIIETDDEISPALVETMSQYEPIEDVILLEGW